MRAAVLAVAFALAASAAAGQSNVPCSRATACAQYPNTRCERAAGICGGAPICYRDGAAATNVDCTARCDPDPTGCPGAGDVCELTVSAADGFDFRCARGSTTPPGGTEPGCVQCAVDACSAIQNSTIWANSPCAGRRDLTCSNQECASGSAQCTPLFTDSNGDRVDCSPNVATCSAADCGTVPTQTTPRLCPGFTNIRADYFSTQCVRLAADRCGFPFHPCPPPPAENCPRPVCPTTCPNGVERNTTTGCPTCVCSPPDCSDRCPAVTCGRDQILRRVPGTCCGVCVDRPPSRPANCLAASCPEIRCNATAGEVAFRPADRCCPRCVKREENERCPNGRCADDVPPTRTCPAGTRRVETGCCATCEPIPQCDRVTCDVLTRDRTNPNFCDLNTHVLRRRPGECCPVCVPQRPRDACAGVRCPDVSNCPAGTTARRSSDSCCPTCEIDVCARVNCVRDPNATYFVQRADDCCPTPVYCHAERDPTTGRARRVCSLDDQRECATGVTERNAVTGDCDDVPATRREERRIIVDRRNPDPTCMREEDLRDMIMRRLRNLPDARTVDVRLVRQGVDANGNCRYEIILRRVRPNAQSPPTPDAFGRSITDSEDDVRADIAADADLTEVPQSSSNVPSSNPGSNEEESAATTVAASLAVAATAAAVAALA